MFDDARTPEGWFKSLPPLTKMILAITFLITLLTTAGIVSPSSLVFHFPLALYKLQMWRFITNYLYLGPFSIGWLMHMYLFSTFSSKLEINQTFPSDQGNSSGSYLFYLVFTAITIDVLSLILNYPFGLAMLAPGLLMSIIYYWSRKEPYAPLSLWGFQLSAYQFPYALLFLQLIMGNSIWVGIIGVASAHLYYFLRDVLPQEKGITLLPTPRICDEFMNRALMFDATNISESFKNMISGYNANSSSAPGGQGPTFAGARPVAQPRTTTTGIPRAGLFSGAGHRVAD